MYSKGHLFRRSVGWRSQSTIRFQDHPSSSAANISEATVSSEATGYIFGYTGGTKSGEESCGSFCRLSCSRCWALQKSLVLEHLFPSWAASSLCLGPSLTLLCICLELGPDQKCLRLGTSGLQSHFLEISQWDDSYRSCLLEHPPHPHPHPRQLPSCGLFSGQRNQEEALSFQPAGQFSLISFPSFTAPCSGQKVKC